MGGGDGGANSHGAPGIPTGSQSKGAQEGSNCFEFCEFNDHSAKDCRCVKLKQQPAVLNFFPKVKELAGSLIFQIES